MDMYQTNKDNWKKAFDQLSSGVLIINRRGDVQYANDEFLKVSSYSKNELIGRNVAEFFSGRGQLIEKGHREVSLKRKNGGTVLQWIQVNPIEDADGRVRQSVILLSPCQQCGVDPLTQLPNRHTLEQEMEKLLKSAKNQDSLFAVLFLDLDRFKFVNDTLGHSAGDSLLKQVTERLRKTLDHRHLIARNGGDEFVCLLNDLRSEKEAERIANKIIEAFRTPFSLKQTEVYMTTSVGISLYPYDGDDHETLVTNADSAMYRAKKSGKNKIKKAEVEMNAGAFERLLIENSLQRALENDEFTLVYQPQLDLTLNKATAFEALIRWDHPDLGMISPADFIPIAEETGLIIPIGDWVLQTACNQIKEWEKEGYSSLRVSVNLSAQQIFQKGLVEKLKDMLRKTKVQPHSLELEITESMFIHDVKSVVLTLHQLRELGVRISIDDFGTGYSSLSYLRNLPVDHLKIDRSFIADIETNPSSKALTNAITMLAHDLDLKVVVEGVETAKQLDYVKNSSCDVVQGFYFSKPLQANDVRNFLIKQVSNRL
ncbi:EAL domain-containing protein [Bacillus shivajii]|uniref:sensor domain-containing protein n=1 Tax=Bacillus shivajii TaxID=1983719 RepID=UPI001CFAFEB4|nr:GGDEF and EAL domain-containing protein [Bacillus shivajii]UCZ53966.1 EAL domain-containing protein [Bacillus shivajii]